MPPWKHAILLFVTLDVSAIMLIGEMELGWSKLLQWSHVFLVSVSSTVVFFPIVDPRL
jgi:hypothetical protein